jgi:hypothetical protein
MYTKGQTGLLKTSRIQFASIRVQIRHPQAGQRVSEAQGQMNLLSRSLFILFPPRLPRFTREDVAGTAEYCKRLARQNEANMDSPHLRRDRISMHLALGTRVIHPAVKMPQKFLDRMARVFRRNLLEHEWRAVLQK